jgi:hypothetical protein
MNSSKFALKGILFRFKVWRHMEPTSFNAFHTFWSAVMSISHSFCDGEAWRKAGLPYLRKIKLFIPLLASIQWSIQGLLSFSGQYNFIWVHMYSPLKISKRCQPPQAMQLLPGNHCSILLKEKLLGFLMDYHISSNLKLTHISLQGTAHTKNVHYSNY